MTAFGVTFGAAPAEELGDALGLAAGAAGAGACEAAAAGAWDAAGAAAAGACEAAGAAAAGEGAAAMTPLVPTESISMTIPARKAIRRRVAFRENSMVMSSTPGSCMSGC